MPRHLDKGNDCYALGWLVTDARREAVMAFGLSRNPDWDRHVPNTASAHHALFRDGRDAVEDLGRFYQLRLHCARTNQGEPQDDAERSDWETDRGREMLMIGFVKPAPRKVLLLQRMSKATLEWLQKLLGPVEWYKTLYPSEQWERHGL